MNASKHKVSVTSEASDGQSAMEMVILYCVSLGRGKESIGTEGSPPLKSWSLGSHAKKQPCMICCHFRKVSRDGRRDAGSPPPLQLPEAAWVLTCTFPYRSRYKSVCVLYLISMMNSNMLFGENKKSKHLFR